MANEVKATPEAAFRHNTSIGPNGKILYDCPIEIQSKKDLANYGITWNDCRTLSFGGEKVRVFFYRTENRALAEDHWSYLNTQHSKGYRSVRCIIPGTLKPWIKCPDTNVCASCPYRDVRKPPVISWDGLIESGYEPATTVSAEEVAIGNLEYQAIQLTMNTVDGRISKVLELQKCGYSIAEIAAVLHISEQRVYQLRNRGKAIDKECRKTTC